MARACPPHRLRRLDYLVDDRTAMGQVLERLMSAFGPKRTFHYVAFSVAFGGKADMPFCSAHVRF